MNIGLQKSVLVKQERIVAKEILVDQWLAPMKMAKQFLLVAGVVRLVIGCARKEYPGVYARLANYID